MKTPFLKILMKAVVIVIVFVVTAIFLKWFLIPRLPTAWQSNTIWIIATSITTTGLLASLSQITGYSLKDWVNRKEQHLPSQSGSILIKADDGGTINFTGDILKDKSTKIVIEHAVVVNDAENENNKVERLIKDVRVALYGDNKTLPYALTLSLDLCNKNENLKNYKKWIEIELKGYEDYENLKSNFDADISFEEWENKWASYRKIKCYIKASMPTKDRQYLEIRPLQYGEIFIAFSISQIVRMLQDSKTDAEFSVLLASLGKDKVEEIGRIISKYSTKVNIPPDLRLFYEASELEKILNGVREKVLKLINEVRHNLRLPNIKTRMKISIRVHYFIIYTNILTGFSRNTASACMNWAASAPSLTR